GASRAGRRVPQALRAPVQRRRRRAGGDARRRPRHAGGGARSQGGAVGAMRADPPARVAPAAPPPARVAFRRRWTRWTRLRTALLGWMVAGVLRLLYATFRLRCIDPDDALGAMRRGDGTVLAFWHEALLLVPVLKLRGYRGARVTAMLGWHADAEI